MSNRITVSGPIVRATLGSINHKNEMRETDASRRAIIELQNAVNVLMDRVDVLEQAAAARPQTFETLEPATGIPPPDEEEPEAPIAKKGKKGVV